MGCEVAFYILLVTFSVALITYNILVSSVAPLRPDFPDPDGALILSSHPGFLSIEPIIEIPQDGDNDGDGSGKKKKKKKKNRLFHTVVTASDSVYNTWQCRIMYYWYKKKRNMMGSDMGGFTRILHSGMADGYMDEIPTFVADPLPDGLDNGYTVLNRPWAFVQWLRSADIQEEYILMAEPDHIIVNPIPNLSKGGLSAAFPFFYIEPKKYQKVIRKFYPVDKGPIANIDPIGNSPVIIDKESLKKIVPTWMNISLAMKGDPEADKAFGWVLEMYAYAIASASHGIGNILIKDFMIQPPWDAEVGSKFMVHYTYGCDFDTHGKLTYGKIGEWRFDKRSFMQSPPPKNLPLPPTGVPESVVTLIEMVNEATANIPDWGG